MLTSQQHIPEPRAWLVSKLRCRPAKQRPFLALMGVDIVAIIGTFKNVNLDQISPL